MNLVGKSECGKSPGGEGIIPRDIREMPRVVESEDADVVPAADLKTVDPTVRRDDPLGRGFEYVPSTDWQAVPLVDLFQ